MSDEFIPDPTPGQAPQPAGMLEAGNIDLNNRPIHRNSDGSISTVRSASFGLDGKEVLLPTIADDGTPLSDDQAVQLYRNTGKHLGKFASPDAATAYAQSLHEAQAKQYLPKAAAQDDFIPDSDTSFLSPEAKNRPRPTPQSATANDETAGDEDLATPASKRTFEASPDLPGQFRALRADLDAKRSAPIAALNVAGNSAVFGLGPAYVAAQNKLVSLLPGQAPTTYDAERSKAQAQLERDRGTLGTPGTIAAETIGGLAPALLAPEAGLASEISNPLARGVATGATYGAAQGAGESVSKGDTAHIGRNALEGAAAGGLTGGVLEGTLGRLSAHASGDADAWLLHDIAGADAKTQATPSARKLLNKDETDVQYTVAADPAIRKQVSRARGSDPTELDKLNENLQQRINTVFGPREHLYGEFDAENPNGGFRVGDMEEAVRKRARDFDFTGGESEREALDKLADSLKRFEGRDTLIPDVVVQPGPKPLTLRRLLELKKEEAAGTSDPLQQSAAQQQIDQLTKQYGQVTYNPEKIIPTVEMRKVLTKAQDKMADALGSIKEGPNHKLARVVLGPVEDSFDAHLNTGDPELVAQIRDMNRKGSAYMNMQRVVEQRAIKAKDKNIAVQKTNLGLRAAARSIPGGGAALAFGTGHPVIGTAMLAGAAAPELARGADMALARLIAASKKPTYAGTLAGLVQDAITKGVPRSVAMQFGGSAAGGEIHKAAAEIAP